MYKGPIKVYRDMDYIKEILIQEGFTDPAPLQIWKERQIFGLVKKINDDLEMHVRGYDDSTLDSEIELSREYLEHPGECKPYYGPLLEILSRYKIRYEIIRPLPRDPSVIKVPKNKTPWKLLMFIFFGLMAIPSFLFLLLDNIKKE